jgi:hypothetical protein
MACTCAALSLLRLQLRLDACNQSTHLRGERAVIVFPVGLKYVCVSLRHPCRISHGSICVHMYGLLPYRNKRQVIAYVLNKSVVFNNFL